MKMYLKNLTKNNAIVIYLLLLGICLSLTGCDIKKYEYMETVKVMDKIEMEEMAEMSEKTETIKEIEKKQEMQNNNTSVVIATVNVATETKIVKAKENDKKNVNLKTVYLTIDDGPGEFTDDFLELFDKYGAKVTYFCTNNSKSRRERIKKIYERGHTIGIHSYSHDAKKIYQSIEAFYTDLVAEEEVVKSVIGTHTRYVRLPYGSSTTLANYNPGIITKITESLTKDGFEYFDWNVSAEESSKYENGIMIPEVALSIATTQIEKIIEKKTAQSIIILCHDTSVEEYQYITLLLEYLYNNGFEVKGIDDETIPVHHTIYN